MATLDGPLEARERSIKQGLARYQREREEARRRVEAYWAAIESAATSHTGLQMAEFTQRVRREITRRRFGQVPRAGVIGDGAPWIWNIAEELFPQAVQLVDC